MDIAVTEKQSPVLPDLFPTCLEALELPRSICWSRRARASRRWSSAAAGSTARCSTSTSSPRTATPGSPPTSPACSRCWSGRSGWKQRGQLSELENLMLQTAYGEYLAQIAGGIPMTQVEMVRPRDMGVSDEALHAFWTPAVAKLINERQHRRRADAHRRS